MISERCSTGNGQQRGKDALRQIPQLIQELRDYAAYYAGIRKDMAGAKARDAAGAGALAILGVIVLASVMLVSMWLMLTGIAIGLTWLLSGWEGLAYFLLGFVVLGVTALSCYLAVRYWQRRQREGTIKRYEYLKEVHHRTAHVGGGEQAADAVRVAEHQSTGQ